MLANACVVCGVPAVSVVSILFCVLGCVVLCMFCVGVVYVLCMCCICVVYVLCMCCAWWWWTRAAGGRMRQWYQVEKHIYEYVY